MAAAFVQRLLPLLSSDRRLILQYYTEDAFYLHSVARHFAMGQGITIDGVRPTNGFQPLSLLLYSPFYLLSSGDRLPALRMAYGAELLISLIATYCVYAVVRELVSSGGRTARAVGDAPFWAAVLWYTPLRVIRNDMNGLETGLYALLLAGSTLAYLRFRQTERRRPLRAWLVGLLLGLTFLARNDAVFFGISLAVGHLLLDRQRRARIEVVLMAAGATCVGLPWIIFNHLKFGSIVPQSGHAESLGAHFGSNIVPVLHYLAGYGGLTVQFPLPVKPLPALTALVVTSILAVLLFRRHARTQATDLRQTLRPIVTTWAGYVVALVLFYALVFGAAPFIFRFLLPVWMFAVLTVSIPLAALLTPGPRSSWQRALAAQATVAALTCLGYVRDFRGVSGVPWFRPVVQFTDWAKAHVRAGEVIASNQTGMLGYFVDNVVNLDGKTNLDALRAREQDRYTQYFCETVRPDYFIEWTAIAEALRQEPLVERTYEVLDRQDGPYDYEVLVPRARRVPAH